MKCPACDNQLKSKKFKNHTLDFCLKCGGVWFDKGELNDTVQELVSNPKFKEQSVKEAFNVKAVPYDPKSHPVRYCPCCNKEMQIINYFYDSNVFIDKCPACEGIWTDKREVKKIARHNKGNQKVKAMCRSLAQATDEHIKYGLQNKKIKELSSRKSISEILLIRFSIFPLPLKDDNPIKTVPIATLGLIVLNVLIFVYQAFFMQDPESFIMTMGLIPANAFESHRVFAFVSSMFLHGGIMHLLGNMFFLWLFGDNLEDEWGSLKFLGFYFLCGIAGGLVFVLLNPMKQIPVIGASGAISGILGGYLLLYPDVYIHTFWLGEVRRLSAFGYLMYWIIFQLLCGVLVLACRGGSCSGVAYWAHIGGFACGAAVILIGRKIRIFLDDTAD